MQSIPPIWTTHSPSTWAKAPEWMTFHFLVEAERCPRSATLRNSGYQTVWNAGGYPEKPTVSATTGRIIHMSIQKIAVELARKGCCSVHDARATEVLKALGGYSSVISDIAEFTLIALGENPRFHRMRDSLSVAIRSQIHRMREKVQVLISRLAWKTIVSGLDHYLHPELSAMRATLAEGAHFEIELRDEYLKWKGIVDLIDVQSEECSITDFKSGNESELHDLQIRIYALLWRRDKELNPVGQLATRLALSYPTKTRLVPMLSEEQIEQLGSELKARTEKIRQAVNSDMPLANLSEEACAGCQVRQLCSEYWTNQRQRACSKDRQGNYFDDIEVVLTDQKSPQLWRAQCVIATGTSSGADILLRVPESDTALHSHFMPGARLRIIGAFVLEREVDEIPLVQIATTSEFLFRESHATEKPLQLDQDI